MKQYDIVWANMPAPIGKRPVLLLTRTSAYEYLAKVIVVEVSSTVRGIAQEVALGTREGVRKHSVANCDNVHVVPISSLGARIGELRPSRIWEVKRALGFALDWDELKVQQG